MANKKSFLKRIFSRKTAVGILKKAAGMVSTAWAKASWSPRNYQNFAQETYMKNVIAFRCMDYIAKSVASVDFKLYKQSGTERTVVENHPLNRILTRPNPSDSWSFFMIKNIVYLLISGNDFIQRISPTTGRNSGIPQELHVLRPDKMVIKTDSNDNPVLYSYDNGGMLFPIDPVTGQADILHMKLFHPLNDIWGMSVVEPAAREIDSLNEAVEMNKKSLENEGRPGMMLFVKGALTEKQWDRLEKQMKQQYGGSSNAGKTLILESDFETKASPYSWTPKEMDFLESKRDMSRSICNAFGVPPMLIGIPGDNTYSNYQEARQAFWEETVFFYLKFYKGELNNWLLPDDSIFIDYDLNNVPALQSKRDQMWERAAKSTFLTTNEKREMVGYEKTDGGDVLLVPANLIPISLVGQIPDDNNDSDDEKQAKIDAVVKKTGVTEDEAAKLLGYTEYEK
jgi:HK97 family phage portal protein